MHNTRFNSYSADMTMLRLASSYAHEFSGCTKVNVGAAIVRDGIVIALGANQALPDLCTTGRGCMRVELYGENSKDHRLPSDCRAIHSEIDAICNAAASGVSTRGATMYVTRYPCEACARAIVAAGISAVLYGREQSISEETKRIFEAHDVDVCHHDTFKEDDTTI